MNLKILMKKVERHDKCLAMPCGYAGYDCKLDAGVHIISGRLVFGVLPVSEDI